MDDNRPDPLTAPDCDLRDFPYMPLDVVRLRDSETAVLLTPGEFRAAILLWCASWHQVPAASLPNDDRLLAMLAGFGRYQKGWAQVKAGAIRGFIECKDGRLYHQVVAEKAQEAFQSRTKQRHQTAAAREAKAQRERENNKENNKIYVCNSAATDAVTASVALPQTGSKGREGKGSERTGDNGGGRVTRGAPSAVNLIAGSLLKQFKDVYRGAITKAAERKFLALLAAGENADPIIAAAHRANPEMPAEQWLDERGWAQLSLLPDAGRKPLISPEAMALGDEIAVVAGQDLKFLEPGWCGAAWRCQQWLDQGWPRELIVAGVKAMVTQKAPEKISGVAYFDKGLARFIAQQTRPVPKVIEHQAETVEMRRGANRDDSRSGIAAIGRVYDKLRTGTEMQPEGGGEVPDPTVQRLPA